MHIRVMRESLVLIAIGLFDLGLTLVLLGHNQAQEGNPLMAYYLQFGIGAFVAAKLSLLFGPVMVAEWSNLSKPRFTKMMMRAAIAAYVGSYLVLFMIVNVAPRISEITQACAAEPVRMAQHLR